MSNRATLPQGQVDSSLHRSRVGRWALDPVGFDASGTVGYRLGDSNLAVLRFRLAMDFASWADHGGDPRLLHLSLLGVSRHRTGRTWIRAAIRCKRL